MSDRGVPTEPRELVLSEPVFLFLCELRPEEIKLLTQAIQLVRALIIVGKVLKWTIAGLVAIFIASVTVWEKILFLLQ